MSGIFNLDAPIWVFMGEVADIIILALLWWCCSLGIITIGASTTALYYVIGKKIRKEQTYVARDFFKSFRQNFRQSVPLSVVLTIAFVSLGLYVSFIIAGINSDGDISYLKYMIPVTILFAFEVLGFNSMAWALLSRFEMPTKAVIKTSFAMMHKHLLTTVWNLVVIGIVCFGIVKFSLLLVVAPSCIVWGQSFVLQPLFAGYIEASQGASITETDEIEAIEVAEQIDEDNSRTYEG